MNVHTTTQLGTPWAATWTNAWAASVEEKEIQLDRRICGARTLSSEPCTLTSDHHTGRCRYHGGTDAIGAPLGNQNARVHGLYARRLQRCGTHCPMWDHCPFAGDDVLALDPKERPVCAYEAAEYDALLEKYAPKSADTVPPPYKDSRNIVDPDSDALENPVDIEIHNLALMQVMWSRAAAALSVTALTDTVTSESETYQLSTTKLHPAVQAFLRIGRELRAMRKDFRNGSEAVMSTPEADATDARHTNLASVFQSLDPELLSDLEAMRIEAFEAEGRQEEYTRRLEWIAHDQLGLSWREQESIREFAVPRAVPVPGAPTYSPSYPTPPPPPNEHPPSLVTTRRPTIAQPP